MLVSDLAMRWATGPGVLALRILAMGATELNHKVLDDTVKMQSIVKLVVDKIDKIAGRYRHLIEKNLGLECTECCIKNGNRIGHEITFQLTCFVVFTFVRSELLHFE